MPNVSDDYKQSISVPIFAEFSNTIWLLQMRPLKIEQEQKSMANSGLGSYG